MTPVVYTPNDIWNLSYVEFCAFLGQPNIPPGGLESICRVARKCFLDASSLVLDPGCNTGYVSIELARLTGCRVIGLDLSAAMIEVACQRALRSPTEPGRVIYVQGDATDMLFPDGLFDAVVCGGSTAFMQSWVQAIHEYARVVRPWGYVADIEFYYAKEPRPGLLDEINAALGTHMPAFTRSDWLEMFEQEESLHRFYLYEGELQPMVLNEIEAYVNDVVEYMDLQEGIREAVRERWMSLYKLFAENRSYLAYLVMVYRKLPEGEWW